jgi:hypothetical protein
MFKNRFLALIIVVPLFVAAVLLVHEVKAAESQNDTPVKAMECESNLALDAGLDSATRSYIAWAKAVEAESSLVDSATQSYIAWAKAIEEERYTIDSATRSYIAWAKAVEAQRLACY